MTYRVEEIDTKRIVHLNGEIDMDVADKARQTILPLIEAGHEVHLNLSKVDYMDCLLYTSPSPRDLSTSRMPSSA